MLESYLVSRGLNVAVVFVLRHNTCIFLFYVIFCRLQHTANSVYKCSRVRLEPFLFYDVTLPRLNFYFGCSHRNMMRD